MRHRSSPSILAKLWGFNIVLLLAVFFVQFGVQYLKSSVLEYSNVHSDAFDGTVYPITYVPNWLTVSTQNKSLRFEEVALEDFVETPTYDADLLSNSDTKNKLAIQERGTYITPYMGSYRMNFEEYDGSHLGVDIRAPLGTPVLSIANGVVIKTNDSNNSDGKYVIIRHENITYNGVTGNFYSAYLHLESFNVVPGDIVKKGQAFGKVGLTGITTTPHLHFQIDKADAPFHPYWPYTFAESQSAGLSFFDAVNVGLGRENAIKYTVHPLDFVQDLEDASSEETTGKKDVLVASSSDAVIKETVLPVKPVESKPTEVEIQKPVDTSTTEIITKPSNHIPEETPDATEDAPKPSAPSEPAWIPTSALPFKDVDINSVFYGSTKYLYDNAISKGYEDGSFGINNSLTRREVVVLLARAFKVSEKENAELPYNDLPPSDPSYGYLASFLENGIVSKAELFRPSDTITRSEVIIMLVRLSKLPLGNTTYSAFKDVARNDTRNPYFTAFARKFGIKRSSKLQPESIISRWEFAKVLVSFLTK